MPRKLNNHHRMVLTAHEEKKLVETLIHMERVGGGWTCAELSDTVVPIVDACHYINKHPTPGRPFVGISTTANTIRVNRRVGKSWFTCFFVDWRHLILEKKPQTLAAISAQCCTIQQYFLHFAQLGETLKRFGLMDSTGFITNPDNVIHSYECPNIINGIRNVNGGKIIGGSGGSATTIVGEEHADNVSLMATCGLDGHKYNPQLNYAWKNLDTRLFTETLGDPYYKGIPLPRINRRYLI